MSQSPSASTSISESSSSSSTISQTSSFSASLSQTPSSTNSPSFSPSQRISVTLSPSPSLSLSISPSASPSISQGINYTMLSPSGPPLAPTEITYSLNVTGIAIISTLGFAFLMAGISTLVCFIRRRNANRFKRRVSRKPMTVITKRPAPIQYTQPRIGSNTKVVYLSDDMC